MGLPIHQIAFQKVEKGFFSPPFCPPSTALTIVVFLDTILLDGWLLSLPLWYGGCGLRWLSTVCVAWIEQWVGVYYLLRWSGRRINSNANAENWWMWIKSVRNGTRCRRKRVMNVNSNLIRKCRVWVGVRMKVKKTTPGSRRCELPLLFALFSPSPSVCLSVCPCPCPCCY